MLFAIDFPMKLNGIMIDSARLVERHAYYYRLVEFMAQWKLNVLLFHFCDDQGCALRLPGFEALALPRAFSTREIGKWIAFAAKRGIDVIPEIETFGHTRYLTDNPRYRHLCAGDRKSKSWQTALDPLHPDTIPLMRRLITAVARLFPSPYLHLGCDEVDMTAYCRKKGLQIEKTWADYVNRLAALARRAGKEPMIWADHPARNRKIAQLLRKDLILVEWRYTQNIRDTVLPALKKHGFRKFIVAPSLACYIHRFLPTTPALENTRRMAAFGAKHKVLGLINTIWCPWRYLQNAMYYGIAYSAHTVRHNGRPDMRAFQRQFARRVFGTGLTPALREFLECWPALAIDYSLATRIFRQADPPRRNGRQAVFSTTELKRLQMLRKNGAKVLAVAGRFFPAKGTDIWHGMVLAAKCAWLCAESLLLSRGGADCLRRKTRYNEMLQEAKKEMSQEWERTRFPGDPQKLAAPFLSNRDEYAMTILQKLH